MDRIAARDLAIKQKVHQTFIMNQRIPAAVLEKTLRIIITIIILYNLMAMPSLRSYHPLDNQTNNSKSPCWRSVRSLPILQMNPWEFKGE